MMAAYWLPDAASLGIAIDTGTGMAELAGTTTVFDGKLIHSGRKLSEPAVHEELGRLGIFPIRNR